MAPYSLPLPILPQGRWFFQKRQESTLTQSDPSTDDGFDVAAFYVEGQLDFPNQVPGNVLQLYRELYDTNQKVKELENEIAVYVMAFQNKSHPVRRGVIPMTRKTNNVPRKCCIPGLWNCARPASVMSDTHQRKRTIPDPRNKAKKTSVNTAVQTINLDNRGSRLSKVSWNSKVDVRYIGSGIESGKAQKAPLHEDEPTNAEELKNVVHLKIKIPKDVLNLKNADGGRQASMRLENEWKKFNSENENENKISDAARNKDAYTLESMAGGISNNQVRTHTYSKRSDTHPPEPLNSNADLKEEVSQDDRHAIVGTSIVQNERDESAQLVGIPVKQPGKSVCDSKGCTCMGSKRNDSNLEKVRQSFDMTESELSLLEEVVHNTNPGPTELKIQTEYGSVNVTSHDTDCKCKICETFGSHDKTEHKQSGRSDSAAVISKKIIRVHYNGQYRNIITHTEECGCDICSNIEEHSYRLMRARASIVSTHQGELVVKNKGVCGCENCKTVEMSSHVVDVETLLSRTSSHVMDQCYYSDATIPSLQSFPRECLSTTDDQGAISSSSPPSINSSDLSEDVLYDKLPESDASDLDNFHMCRVGTSKRETSKCENIGSTRVYESTRIRTHNFVKPSSTKSSPAELHKNKDDSKPENCASCKKRKGKNTPDKGRPASIISGPPAHEKQLERALVIDTKDTVQSNKSAVFPDDNKKDEKDSSRFEADKTTLEDLIRDLIRGETGIKKDKVYTVTLGEIAKRAYTKIHVVSCSGKSEEKDKTKTMTGGVAKTNIRLPNGDGSNSNVFFIKTLTSRIELPRIRNPALLDSDDNSPNPQSRSMSSPACIEGDPEQQQSSQLSYPEKAKIMSNRPEGDCKFKKIGRSSSETTPRSDVSRKAFKLTISFGRKVASFFKQRVKKRTMSNQSIFPQIEVSQANPKCFKAFTIYEGAEKLRSMEMLQIEVKPRYFTIETNNREEQTGSSKLGPILCLVEKDSNTQVLATVAT